MATFFRITAILFLTCCCLIPLVSAQEGSIIQDNITAIAWSPDGNTIALGGEQGIWLYDANNLNAGPRHLEGYQTPVENVVFRGDGQMLASTAESPDDTIYLWDVASGNQLAALYPSDPDTEKEDHAHVILFYGDLLASGHDTGRIWFWNTNPEITALGTPISIFQMPQAVENLLFLYSDHIHRMTSLHSDGQIYTWDLTDGSILESAKISPRSAEQHAVLIQARMYYRDYIILANNDLLDWPSLEIRPRLPEMNNPGVTAAIIQPNNLWLTIATADGQIIVMDGKTGEHHQSWETGASPITAMNFDQHGMTLLTLSENGQVLLWDVASETARQF